MTLSIMMIYLLETLAQKPNIILEMFKHFFRTTFGQLDHCQLAAERKYSYWRRKDMSLYR